MTERGTVDTEDRAVHSASSPSETPERLLRIVAGGVSLAFHLGVVPVFSTVDSAATTLFAGDLAVFAGLSLALSIAMRVPRVGKLSYVFLGVRLVLYSFVGASLASSPIPAALLLAALAVDAGTCFSSPWNLLVVLSVGMTAIAAEIVPSTLQPGRVGRTDLLPLLPVPAAAAGLSILLRLAIDQLSIARGHAETLNDAVIQLTSANSGFLRFASNAERESALEERRHITRELHDIVGQTLTDVIAMMDASIRNPMDTVDEQKRLHQWIRDQSQRCLQETRQVLYRLRSMPDAPLSGTAAIQSLVQTFSVATGVRVRLEWSNTPVDLGEPLNTVYYRVVQEALVNAFRHGRASEVMVEFWLEHERVHLMIEDDGQGTVESKKGIGQQGMEERIGEVGGSISFGSTATGYQVRVSCPYTGGGVYEATADSPRR